jgi:hypothetical protein
MKALNNWVKVMFNTLVWSSVCRWQVLENKSLVHNLLYKTFQK